MEFVIIAGVFPYFLDLFDWKICFPLLLFEVELGHYVYFIENMAVIMCKLSPPGVENNIWFCEIKIKQNQFDLVVIIYHKSDMEICIDSKKLNIKNCYLD